MKKHLLITCALIASSAWAQDKIAYPSFTLNNERYVFSDFQTAQYNIKYDAQTKKATYQAIIKLEVKEAGRVIFDVVIDPTRATLDGKVISVPQMNAPDNATKFRSTSEIAEVGIHELQIEGDLTRLVNFDEDGVRSAYWLNDLYDRSYLENYVPSSFEYDTVKMTFAIDIKNAIQEHTILTNGSVTQKDKNSFTVSYPEYYNTASIFFHMLPKDRIHSEKFTLRSVDGRNLPGMIYYPLAKGQTATAEATRMLKEYRTVAENKFAQLEKDFGKFLHSSLVVYATDGGGFPGIAGMEYCGATMTNLDALEHELTHSYFGRGIVPANGNAGWLDEAITTWGTDTNYTESSSARVTNPSSLYGQKTHARITHRGAYSTGATFMGQLAGKLKERGDKKLVDFLQHMIENNAFKPYSNDDFWNYSKEYFGFSLLDLVTRPSPRSQKAQPYTHQADKAHRRFTDKELIQLL